MDQEEKPLEMKKKFFDLSAKTAFFIGVLVGVSVISVIGLLIILTKPEFNLSSTTTNYNKSTTKTNTQAANKNSAQATAPTRVDLAVQDTDHFQGDLNAPVKIFEFSDLQCPYSGSHHPNISKLVAAYSDQVIYVFKHFPLSSHAESQPAAEAAECIADLAGDAKYFQFIDTLFANQGSLGKDYYLQTAKALGVNETQFTDCLNTGKFTQKVQNDYRQGLAAGVQGTPTTFINGQLISGALPYENLESVVKSALGQ